MKGLVAVTGFALSLTLLSGCKKDLQDKDSVRQGVLNYLSKRGDLNAMDVNVTSVEFRDKEANATVHFQAKGNSSPAAGLALNYVLERKGNEWIVKGRPGSGSGHGMEGMPGGTPGTGNDSLPPGHPVVQPGQSQPGQGQPGLGRGLPPLPELPSQGNGASPSLPPGHPTVNPGQTPGSNK